MIGVAIAIVLFLFNPAYALQVKGDVEGDIINSINLQSKVVCDLVSNCTVATSEFLKFLGYSAVVRDGNVEVKGVSLIVDVVFEGLPEGFDENFKKSLMLFLVGRRFSIDELRNVELMLKLRVRSMGYRDADVVSICRKVANGYKVVLKVSCGPLYILGDLKLSCSRRDVCAFVDKKLSRFKYGKLDISAVKKVIDDVKDHFVSEGFYNIDITFTISASNGGFKKKEAAKMELFGMKYVTLFVKVKEGKRYGIRFEGFPGVSLSKLANCTTFKLSRAVDEFELESSRSNIEKFLKDNGYPYAVVTGKIIEVSPGESEVVFTASRMEHVVIKKVDVDFNLTKAERRFVRRYLDGKPYSASVVSAFVSKLSKRFRVIGFKDVNVSYNLEGSILHIVLNKGCRYVFGDVRFHGDVAGCRKSISIPRVYNRQNLGAVLDKIRNCYVRRGFADVKVSYKVDFLCDDGNGTVHADFYIKPGVRYRFGYIVVRGLKRTKLSNIGNLFIIHPGDVYSEDQVIRQHSVLSTSRLFSSVTLREFRTDKVVNVVIDLKESALLYARGFAGYGTDSGYILSGYSGSYSPYGLGLKFTLFGSYRNKRGYDAIFKVSKPGFISHRNELSYSIVKKEQIYESFKADRTLYRFNLGRRSGGKIFENIGFEVAREKVRGTFVDTEREKFLKRSLYADFKYDARDNPSNPSRGYVFWVKGVYAGRLFGGNTDYYLFETRFSAVKALLSRLKFVARVGFGSIEPFTNKRVPFQDRFFLGGAESVRGYKFSTISPKDARGNFVGGNCYGLINAEVRFPIRSKFEGTIFYDSGEVFDRSSDFRFKLSDWHSSVGAGLRYTTPVGPLRIDYGYKLKKVPDQSAGRFHISFGFPF